MAACLNACLGTSGWVNLSTPSVPLSFKDCGLHFLALVNSVQGK